MINPHPAKKMPGKRPQSLVMVLALGTLFASPHNEAVAASLARSFSPKGSQTLDHSAYEALLDRFVIKGKDGINRVNYRGLKSQKQKLHSYLDRMQSVSVPSLSSNAAKAFWLNLYNAKTLDVIIRHHPVSSIRDINPGGGLLARGPWKKKLLKVGGIELSLDDIEHEIARKTWKDPRLHYGFNCASIGCPNLQTAAFTTGKIDAQLDNAAREFINHPRAIAAGRGGLTVSKLYKWYRSDFGNAAQLRAHWIKYATRPLKTAIQRNSTIKTYRYDWSLNEAR